MRILLFSWKGIVRRGEGAEKLGSCPGLGAEAKKGILPRRKGKRLCPAGGKRTLHPQVANVKPFFGFPLGLDKEGMSTREKEGE